MGYIFVKIKVGNYLYIFLGYQAYVNCLICLCYRKQLWSRQSGSLECKLIFFFICKMTQNSQELGAQIVQNFSRVKILRKVESSFISRLERILVVCNIQRCAKILCEREIPFWMKSQQCVE